MAPPAKYYVCCLLHSEMGRGVEAEVTVMPLGEILVRCKACLEFGRALLERQRKAAEAAGNPKKALKRGEFKPALVEARLFCVGCGKPGEGPEAAQEYKCKACQAAGVPWPTEEPAVKPMPMVLPPSKPL